MFSLTPSQQQAFNKIQSFLQNGSDVFILKGYAGTGKTTLIKYVVENLDYLEDVDAYNTFVKKQNTTTSRTELPHITIDSSTDTDNSDSSKNESEEASEKNEDSSLNSGEENDAYYDPNNNNDPTYYDNDNYYDDYGYDGGYNDYGYDEGYYE